MNAHPTPGPWRIHDKHVRYTLILAGPDEAAKSIVLAEVRDNDARLATGEAKANAKLIAAAPDLLIACQMIRASSSADFKSSLLWGQWCRDIAIAALNGDTELLTRCKSWDACLKTLK